MATNSPAPRASSQSSTDSDSGSYFIDTAHSVTEAQNAPYISPGSSQAQPASDHLGVFHDPRSSSTQSLRPVESPGENRRTLLLIYIHGFLGDETSFMGFPAHVHGLLAPALASTHVVYTKVYPRYKSRKNISYARDAFSLWLAPHESEKTDVILVGHSLGGILAAEAVLMPSEADDRPRHRILGLVAFDTPFLGMHPGVVGTGIASLFRSPPQPEQPPIPVQSPFWHSTSTSQDPTFNPSYYNDVHLANRQGKLQRAWYFWNKHAGELAKATSDYVSSHIEFGGCLADYPGLKRRYNAIRALEDIDETRRSPASGRGPTRRVRFVNYYSASTGPVRERPPSAGDESTLLQPSTVDVQSSSASPSSEGSLPLVSQESPRFSLAEHRDGEIIPKDLTELSLDSETPASSVDSQTTLQAPDSLLSKENSHSSPGQWNTIHLPPLPELPKPPPEFDPSQYVDEDVKKLLRNEHDWKVRTFQKAVKDRDKFIKERERLQNKKLEAWKKQQAKEKTPSMDREATSSDMPTGSTSSSLDSAKHSAAAEKVQDAESGKKQKDRKFCALPTNDRATWIRVYMEGIDEVTAHTSMFKMSETYASMVGDVAERIENWVLEDVSSRMLLAEASDGEGKGSALEPSW